MMFPKGLSNRSTSSSSSSTLIKNTTSLHSIPKDSSDDVFAHLFSTSTSTTGTTGGMNLEATSNPPELTRHTSLPVNVRPGEKRFQQPISPNFQHPRGRLTKLFSSSTTEDIVIS